MDGNLKTEQDKIAWIKGRLNKMHATFSSGEKAESVLLASQWLFDSYARNDELLSFVQTMVALEILLGDEANPEQLGHGNLLRNRCAYLISDSQDQRKDILRDFERIYKVRSQIVHRGKSKLTSGERVLLNRLRWMCRRVIQEEVDLLAPNT